MLRQDPLQDYLTEWTDTQISSWDKASFDTDIVDSLDSGLASPTVNTGLTVDVGQSQSAYRSALVVQNCAGWSAANSDAVLSAITQLSDRIESAITKPKVKIDRLADRMTAVEAVLLKLNVSVLVNLQIKYLQTSTSPTSKS